MHKKLFLLFILIASLLLILINFYSIKFLTSVQAYINCESKYSKGQKDASLFLITYLHTEDTAYIQGFRKSINISPGDNVAANGLIDKSNNEIITNGFLMGRNDPTNIPDIIWLYKYFRSLSFMQKSMDVWASTVPLINSLDSLGQNIAEHGKEKTLTAEIKLQYIKEISLISTQLSEKENVFSTVLDKTARDIKVLLQWGNIFFILFIISITGLFVMRMLNRLSASEKVLKATIIELNDTNKELEDFTLNASHDLKEPLRMVTGFLVQLQKRYNNQLDEKAQNYIHYAVDGAMRMKKLIDELLEYSKTSMSQAVYEKVDLNEVVEELQANFQDVFNESGSGIFVGALPEIKVNRMQMLQLFQNLIGNAIKYKGEAAPKIYVNATANNTHWVFSVKDNGQGIETEFYKKIFVIFQRLHTDAMHSGSGIGLAICKKIVERHNGEIWLESEVGKGSTFFFSIAKELPSSLIQANW